jgi:hypothetical protein
MAWYCGYYPQRVGLELAKEERGGLELDPATSYMERILQLRRRGYTVKKRLAVFPSTITCAQERFLCEETEVLPLFNNMFEALK